MNNLIQRLITSIILLASFLLIFFYLPPIVLSLILLAALIYILIFEWPQFYTKNKRYFYLTPLYPAIPFFLLIYLNQIHHDVFFMLVILVTTFDSASYISGKLFGKHLIAPSVSPGKTWQGVIGGLLATFMICWFVLASKNELITVALFFVVGTCIFALLGDLFESYLKRTVGIKDSGNILPGHGGLLDRVDGLLWAAIFYSILLLPC